jgi:hypothetical protein
MKKKVLLGLMVSVLLVLTSILSSGLEVNIPVGNYKLHFEVNDSIADDETTKWDTDTSYSGKYNDDMDIAIVDLNKGYITIGTIKVIDHSIVTAVSDRVSLLKETQEYMKARGWTDITPINRQIAGRDAVVIAATDKDGDLRDTTQFWFKIDKRRELIGNLYFVDNNATEILDSFELIPVQMGNETDS